MNLLIKYLQKTFIKDRNLTEEQIKEIFANWAKTNNLTIANHYKDYDVTSVDFQTKTNKNAQIWLEITGTERKVIELCGWDRTKGSLRKKALYTKAATEELEGALNEIFKDIMKL